MAGETATRAPLYVNKHAFKEYLESFPEGKETTAVKKAKKQKTFSCSFAVWSQFAFATRNRKLTTTQRFTKK